jgi:hypothetical protein
MDLIALAVLTVIKSIIRHFAQLTPLVKIAHVTIFMIHSKSKVTTIATALMLIQESPKTSTSPNQDVDVLAMTVIAA